MRFQTAASRECNVVTASARRPTRWHGVGTTRVQALDGGFIEGSGVVSQQELPRDHCT